MSNDGIDNWLDYLIKRWPLVAAIGFLVFGVLKTQWVQNAQADDMRRINESIEQFSEIKAEWPYLKKRLEDVNNKVDKVDDKLDILINRK